MKLDAGNLNNYFVDKMLNGIFETSSQRFILPDENAITESPLHLAIYRDDIEAAKNHIRNGFWLDSRDKNGYTPLHAAVIKSNIELVKLLIDKKVGLSVQNKHGYTPLHFAIRNGCAELINLFIEKGAELDVGDDGQRTLLYESVVKGNIELAKFFIEKGVRLDVKDIDGYTLLHLAAREGYIELSKLLIDKKAGLSFQNKHGETPLYLAINNDHIELAKLLVEKEAGLDTKANDGSAPLHLIMDRCFIQFKIFDVKQYMELARLFIEKGVGLAVLDRNGNTPLCSAIDSDNVELAKLLIEKEAGLDIKNSDKSLPLHLVIKKGYNELAKLIIEKGIGLDIQDWSASTPLHIAIAKNNKEISKLLIEKMAGVDVKDNDGDTPLHFAIYRGNTELAKLLIEKGVGLAIKNKKGYTPLRLAYYSGNTEISKLIIAKCNEYISTELYNALYDDNVEYAEAIIENIKEMQVLVKNIINIPNQDGYTFLQIASGSGYKNIVKLLIEYGANLNDKNKVGNTSLILALSNNKIDCALLLMKMGANIHLANNYGQTALHIASKLNNVEMTLKLIEEGADLYVADLDGNSFILDIVNTSKQEVPVMLEIVNDLMKSRQVKGIEYSKVPVNKHGDNLLHVACRLSNRKLVEFLIENHINVFDKNIYAETPFTIALYQISIQEKELDELKKEKMTLESSGRVSSSDYIEKFERLKDKIKNNEELLKKNAPLMADIIFAIFDKYIKNSKDLLGESLSETSKFKGFENFLISILPQLLSRMKEDTNPLELALTLNSPNIGRAIATELGKKRLEECLANFPSDVVKSFRESLIYDIDDQHLAYKIEAIPDKPVEKEYQIDALIDMFDELSGYNLEKLNPLELKFKKYLIGLDKTQPLDQLKRKLQGFIDSCKAREKRTGILAGQELPFWEGVERAITNTIKILKTSNGTNEEIYEKKAHVMREYLDLMSYCATRLDVELDEIYYENIGTVREFKDEIYFQLSKLRRQILEGLIPRDRQNVHIVQGMLKKLGAKYNIPIKQSVDLFPRELTILDPETSFRKKYQDSLIDYIKDYLKSNENVSELFFQMLEEEGRGQMTPLPLEQTRDFFTHLKGYEDKFPEKLANKLLDGTSVSKLWKDLYEVFIDMPYKDLDDDSGFKQVLFTYFQPTEWKKGDFKLIIESGDAAFETLDPILQKAIVDSGMKGKLSLFQSVASKEVIELKKKILDQYIQSNFPMMVKQVKEEDVVFLLKTLGVLKVVCDS